MCECKLVASSVAGARLGYALTPLIMGFIIAQFNWRVAFFITGIGSLLFCVFWFLWYDEKKGVQKGVQISNYKKKHHLYLFHGKK